MQQDHDIGGDTSGHETDVGGSHSGGGAGDKPHKAFGDETRDSESAGGITAEDAERADDLPEGRPDDVSPTGGD